jgi:hypothetical protein
MDKIDEQLNSLYLAEIPVGMHQSVMRRVNYQKIKPMLFTAFALLAFSFIAIIWQINTQLINAEFTDMAQDFFNVFNFNFAFIDTIWGSFFEIISPTLFLSAILSLAGAIYIGKKITVYQFSRI